MLEQLYNGLFEDGNISIPFEQFQNKFQNDPNYRQRLHSGIVGDGDFSGDYNTFESKFMGKTQGSPEVTQAEEPIVNRLLDRDPDDGVRRYGLRVGRWFFGVTANN